MFTPNFFSLLALFIISKGVCQSSSSCFLIKKRTSERWVYVINDICIHWEKEFWVLQIAVKTKIHTRSTSNASTLSFKITSENCKIINQGITIKKETITDKKKSMSKDGVATTARYIYNSKIYILYQKIYYIKRYNMKQLLNIPQVQFLCSTYIAKKIPHLMLRGPKEMWNYSRNNEWMNEWMDKWMEEWQIS